MQGGLGNQMFIYSYYLSLKEQRNNNTVFIRPINPAKHERYGSELETIFNINLPSSKPLFERLLLNRFTLNRLFNYVFEDVNTLILKPKPSKYLLSYYIGYWQSYNYFSKLEARIRSVFSFPVKFRTLYVIEMEKEICKYESVSIHIRGGDYITNNDLYGNIATKAYYKSAIQYIKQKIKVSSKPIKFFVFSDDKEYSSNLLEDAGLSINEYLYIDGNNGKESFWDMYLMSLTDHIIIANSTFSWWGAFLGETDSKIIVCPSKVLNKDDSPFFYKDNWTKINNKGEIVK